MVGSDMPPDATPRPLPPSLAGDMIKALQTEFDLERKRHAETLAQLEQARRTQPPKATKVSSPKTRGPRDSVEVICGDVHGNKADPKAVAAFLADVEKIQPDRITLGGDILDGGGFLAEHHTLGYVAETADSYEDDIAAANGFLDALQAAAPNAEIHYLEGNHEWRVERWIMGQKLQHQKDMEFLRRKFAAEFVLRLTERGIRHYRMGEVHDECGVPGWIRHKSLFYIHDLGAGRNAASNALSKAMASVVYFHTHRADYFPTWTPGTGAIAAWNPGCLCKFHPLYSNTKVFGWTHGYLVRYISGETGNFQMVPVGIENGVSFGSIIFNL